MRGMTPARPEDDPTAWRCTLGNGAARAVAGLVVFLLMDDLFSKCDTPTIMVNELSYIWESLLSIPTHYEKHGDGSDRASIVANIARQEQDAKVQGVSTIEWIHIILHDRGCSLGDAHVLSRSGVLDTMNSLMQQYETLPEVQAYDTNPSEPAAKRGRGRPSSKGRAHADMEVEDRATGNGIRIGNRKLTAIKNFLQFATQEQLERISQHLHTTPYKYSGVGDDLLNMTCIYPNIAFDEDGMPDIGLMVPVPVGVTSAPMLIASHLTKDQANFLMDKICSTFESDTCGLTSDDAKSKARMKADDILKSRDVARWWMHAGRQVAKQDLTSDAADDLMQTLLSTSLLDAEVSSLVQRGPSVFHKDMLPSFATSYGAADDALVAQMSSATVTAAKARWELFNIGLQHDHALMTRHRAATGGISALLEWKLLTHRREQAKEGTRLVKYYLDSQWQFLATERMDTVGAKLTETIGGLSANSQVNVLVFVDFNVPHTRDLNKLKQLCQNVAAVLKSAPSSVALVWAPDFAKQNSGEDVDEEEAKIVKELKLAGLDPGRRLRSMLRPHPTVENKTCEFPWFADARLVVDASGNVDANTWLKSKVARTQRFHTEFVLPPTVDLLDITTLAANQQLVTARVRDIYFKASQKGPEFAENCMHALFEPATNWHAKCTSIVVDMAPHAGDRALGLRRYIKALGRDHAMGAFRYIAVGSGVKGSMPLVSLAFSQARLAHHLAKEWMEKSLQLVDEKGQVREPVLVVPDPTDEEFLLIPGGKEAYSGVAQLEFKVCKLSGSKVICGSDWTTEFASAPHEIAAKFREAVEVHDRDWSDLLTDGSSEQVAVATVDATALKSWASVEDIGVEIKYRAKIFEIGVDILVDAAHKIYLLDVAGDRCVVRGTPLGGFGGGTLQNANMDLNAFVPFVLHDGDKTLIQLAKLPGDDASAPKFTSGTLFSILRSLESKGHFNIKLTKYGMAKPTTAAGVGRYEFPDVDPNTNIEYVLTNGPIAVEPTKDSIFQMGLCCA
jgi:hypothetical protein